MRDAGVQASVPVISMRRSLAVESIGDGLWSTVWVYGGPATNLFQTDCHAVCTAQAFGGCSCDTDGDYRLMNDAQLPGDALIDIDFELGHSGGSTGLLWMALLACGLALQRRRPTGAGTAPAAGRLFGDPRGPGPEDSR